MPLSRVVAAPGAGSGPGRPSLGRHPFAREPLRPSHGRPTAPFSTGPAWSPIFRALEQSSPRHPRQGAWQNHRRPASHRRPIAAPPPPANLDRYAWIQKKLADPRLHGPRRSGDADRRRQGGGAHHLLDSRDRTRLSTTPPSSSSTVCLPRTRRASAPSSTTPIFLLVPLSQSGWPGSGRRLVPPDAGHAFRGHGAARLSHKYAGHDLNRDW